MFKYCAMSSIVKHRCHVCLHGEGVVAEGAGEAEWLGAVVLGPPLAALALEEELLADVDISLGVGDEEVAVLRRGVGDIAALDGGPHLHLRAIVLFEESRGKALK